MAFFNIQSNTADITSDMLSADFFEESSPSGVVQLAYPSDIWSASQSYGNSFTAFFISVHKEEELAKTDGATTDTYYYKDRKSGALAEQGKKYNTVDPKTGEVTTDEVMLGVALTGGGAAAGGTFLSSGSQPSAKIAKSVLAGGVVAGIAATGGNNLAFKQQKACIVLPTPNLQSNYNFTWESNSAEVVGAMVAGLGHFNNNNDITNGLWSKIRDVTTALSSSTPMYGDSVSRLTGKSANPRKEQIFKEPQFRQYSFTYTFAPRSEMEARNVEAIIRQFKYHSHPSLTAGDFLYRYPSEFDIVHYHNGTENLHLPKHMTSVLESVSVNYSPAETYTFFNNGMPSIIQLELRFLELGVLTKEDIKKGF